ncbi:MAG TPA: glycosyltransferase [Candidatus Paceibacterota bacterium]|nr:glycosyltransferase [Candidatus Paceibacterota bacterium]
MRVIAFGTDRTILDPDSPARERQRRYAAALGELHAIIFSLGASGEPQHDGPLHIYPTNSKSKLRYGWDALRIARTLPAPEAITAQDPFETGLAALFAARRRKVPLHVQVHTDFLAPGYAAHSRLNRIRRLLAGFVLRRAAGIRAVSPRIKERIVQAYRPKAPISILPIFVDVERFHMLPHTKHPHFDPALLFIGRLEPEKRADIAIRSLARLQSLGIRHAGLTIAGEGSLRARLEAFTRELGVAERVAFLGRTDPAPLLAKADIVLVPSAYEGYGLVIVEALAAGVPVLATDVGIAAEAGALIAPFPSDDFAGALAHLIAKGDLPKGRLLAYPYASEEEYVAAWAADIAAAAGSRPRA